MAKTWVFTRKGKIEWSWDKHSHKGKPEVSKTPPEYCAKAGLTVPPKENTLDSKPPSARTKVLLPTTSRHSSALTTSTTAAFSLDMENHPNPYPCDHWEKELWQYNTPTPATRMKDSPWDKLTSFTTTALSSKLTDFFETKIWKFGYKLWTNNNDSILCILS